MVQACWVGHFVTPLNVGKTCPTDESRVTNHTKSTNHLTNTITRVRGKSIGIYCTQTPINRNTTIRVRAGTKNSRPVGFYSRNSTKSTVNPNATIHKHYHHGGAVRPVFGVGSMDPPDRMRRPSSEGVGRGGGVSG